MIFYKNIIKFTVIILILISGAINPQNTSARFSPPGLISPKNNSKFQPSRNLALVWSDIPGNNLFRVQYSLDTTFAGDALLSTLVVSGTSIVLYQLKHNTDYYWRVRLESDTTYSPIWKFSTTGLPVSPRLFMPADSSINQNIPVTFSWSQDSVNSGYILQIDTSSSYKFPVNIFTKDTSAIVKTFQPYKTYYWRVQANNSDFDSSAWSNTRQFKTRLQAPILITPADNKTNLDTAITFSWSKVDSASTYRIEISEDSLFAAANLFFTKDTSGTSLKTSKFKYATDYFWRVFAFNKAGEISFWSDTSKFRIKFQTPIAVAPSDSLRELDTSVTFTWLAIQNADKYRLQIANDTSFTKITLDSLTTLTNIKFDSLSFSKYYYWRIAARNKNNDTSNWSASRFFITQLQKPFLLLPRKDSINTPTDINFSWTKSDSAAQYRLQLSTDSLFKFKAADTLIKKNLATIKYLLNDTTYYWRVQALRADSITGGRWSATFNFKTQSSLIILPSSILDTINLSDHYTDTLSSVIIKNFGVNPFKIDKALVYPDTLFYMNQTSAIALPGTDNIFTIKFNPSKMKNGLNKGTAYFIRKNLFPKDDTLTVSISVFVKKASVSYYAESIIFGNAYAKNTYIKNFIISNKDGNSELIIKNIAVNGQDTASFKLLDTLKKIPAGEERSIRISFKPARTAKHNALLDITTNSYSANSAEFIITGYGFGGLLDEQSIGSITSLSSVQFDAFATSSGQIQIKNRGNAAINLDISFKNNFFTINNDARRIITLYPEDSVAAQVKYITPNLRNSKTDTMFVISDGFSKDTIIVVLKGRFDSLQAKTKIIEQLKINGSAYSAVNKVFPELNQVVFSLTPSALSQIPGSGFRLKYFNGGSASQKTVYNDGNNNFIIKSSDVNYTGFVFSAEFYITDKNGKAIDSLEIIPLTDGQVVLSYYTLPTIFVPRSKPAETAEKADVKWKLIGFPFANAITDSVFKNLGGRKNMKDGEWVLYKYQPEGTGSFSLFYDFYFEANQGFFIAQSLADSFAVSYTYPENSRTRKLTDTIITLNSNGWKTISNPYLFDVGINSSIPLRKYDTQRKSYSMTYIMKPGEAYFVEPSVNIMNLQTYGELLSITYPKVLADIGWHLKVTAANNECTKDVLLSVDKENSTVSKLNTNITDFSAAPEIDNKFDFFIRKEENYKNYSASVQKFSEGAIWDLMLQANASGNFTLNFQNNGSFPKEFIVTALNNNKIISSSGNPVNLYLQKGEVKNIKVIIGTVDFTKTKISELNSTTVNMFSLSQNYPNPFNPVTVIKYSIPQINGLETQKVQLKIFNTLGKEISTLVNENKTPGIYQCSFDGSKLSSGVYFYQLKTESNTTTKKMILLK